MPARQSMSSSPSLAISLLRKPRSSALRASEERIAGKDWQRLMAAARRTMPPLRTKHVWSIRIKLQVEGRKGDLAMFNLAIDNNSGAVMSSAARSRPPHRMELRSTVRLSVRRKTGTPVSSELSEQTREAVDSYLQAANKKPGEFLFASRHNRDSCMTTQQYSRLVSRWVASIGLDPGFFGTHSLRPDQGNVYLRRTGNLSAACATLASRSMLLLP
jgi:hypothetical protein